MLRCGGRKASLRAVDSIRAVHRASSTNFASIVPISPFGRTVGALDRLHAALHIRWGRQVGSCTSWGR